MDLQGYSKALLSSVRRRVYLPSTIIKHNVRIHGEPWLSVKSIQKLGKVKLKKKQIWLGVLIALLFVGGSEIMYRMRIDLVEVVVAASPIPPRTKIEASMLKTIKVPKTALPKEIYVEANQVVGLYTDIATSLVPDAYFFKPILFHDYELPDEPQQMLKEGQVAFSINADLLKTSGNTLIAGQYVDVYGSLYRSNQEPIVDKVVENVRIVAIKDAKGNDVVIRNSSQTPKVIILAIDDQVITTLKKVVKLGALDVYPVAKKHETLDESIIVEHSQILEAFHE